MPNPNNGPAPAGTPKVMSAPSVRRRRSSKHRRPDPNPDVRLAAIDGERVLYVQAGGTRGEGREFLVDADAWPEIEREHGGGWVLNRDGKSGVAHVRSGASVAAAAARQDGDRPTATLARIIAGARRGERVTYRNGNRLDLRRSNLMVHPRDANAARHVAHAEMRAA